MASPAAGWAFARRTLMRCTKANAGAGECKHVTVLLRDQVQPRPNRGTLGSGDPQFLVRCAYLGSVLAAIDRVTPASTAR